MSPDTGFQPDWPAPPAVRAYQATRAEGPLPDLPAPPSWLRQVHGATVIRPVAGQTGLAADAAVTDQRGVVLAVKTADCLPVLFCDREGTRIGVAHAGWRGLAAGVLEATVRELEAPPASLLAWFGPAIGQRAFEVGPEVREAFVSPDPGADAAFERGRGDRWFADLEALARRRLIAVGVTAVYGGGMCTYRNPRRFLSYRRDGETGRMATLAWLV